jgi:Domain of unknown function (DUF5666)
MKWRSLTVGTAVLVAAAVLPLTAIADTSPSTRASHAWFAGAVTAASSGSVSLDVLWTGPHATQLKGKAVTVAIDSSTQIVFGKGQTGIDPGDLVRIHATATDATLTTLTAKRVHVDCNCHFAAGTLGSIGSSSFAVNVERTGPYDTVLKGNAVTFQVGSATAYLQGKNTAALSDLKTGEKVAVRFAATGFFKDPSFNWQTATFTATHVRFRAAK